MSTWVAFAVKGAAVVGTGSGQGGITRVITQGALYGFAVGTLLTALCFLAIVTLRRSRRAGRPDYYAAPGDTHASVGEPADFPLPVEFPDPVEFPEPVDLRSPELVAAAVQYASPAVPAETEGQADPATEEPNEPELPLEFGAPVIEMFAVAAGDDDSEEAETDPYAPEIFPTVPRPYAPSLHEPSLDAPSLHELSPYALRPYAPNPFAQDPFDEDPSMPDRYAAAEAFGSSGYDDDILLPGDDDDHRGSRGYRSRHRMTSADTVAGRAEARHRAPRHAAPSARFSSRMSSRQAPVPMVPAGR